MSEIPMPENWQDKFKEIFNVEFIDVTPKLKFVQIARYEEINGNRELLGSYINPMDSANVILDEIAEAENGEWEIKIVWMTQAEYDAMPEFQGY